ncbi:hypothetical protein [Dysgonomonas macrotermitis]|uniref:Uncharacterized protein n=1 Tax=Dysgonomonas macrotermitis TaxID=1346286 RepID=A0A1M4SDB7_9BACT|nr:hypothetical protein [Dysgonomonas macrotermitis]SHE30017.1 hypothetical protein SAMN05444362_10124 [Dysgonomonas macrotermitis]
MKKVVETITIEKLEGGAFNVVQGDRYSDQLGWDEMLGLVSALTIAKDPNCLHWMKTKEEHEQHLASIRNMPSEVEFEDILVPEGIGIYMVNPNIIKSSYGDGLFIKFGESQFLGIYEGKWIVNNPIDTKKFINPIQCKLIPCSQDELKAGDTALCYSTNKDFSDIENYMKVLKDRASDFVWIEGEDISICREFDDSDYTFYKVVPV